MGAAPPSTDPHWYNVTANLSTHSAGNFPAVGFGGLMAYDPILSEVVLFNDCSVTRCPGNDTWVYDGTSWANITGTLARSPTAREGSGMDFDPTLAGVVLFGGQNGASDVLNDTWLFTASGWSNITATVGTPVDAFDAPVVWTYGGFAWDPALHGILMVDGCDIASCVGAAQWGQTWLLGPTGWHFYIWGPGTETNSTYLGWNSIAYDAADGYMLEYGGYDFYAGAINYTFTLTATDTAWVNITHRDAGCVHGVCYTPPGRVSDAMTWDAQTDSVFMTDGYNDTSVTWLNDSWTFSGGAWFPANLTTPAAPKGFCSSAKPAMSEWSDNVSPFITGGFSPSGPNCVDSEWVYEAPPHATLTETPHPIDLGTAVTYTAGWVAGTGTGIVAGWNISYGNAHDISVRSGTGQNSSTTYTKAFPYTYPGAGTFTANVTWTDFFYISSAKSTVTLTVNPALAAAITASATSITAGGTVTFSTNPTGGSGTYTYAWSFGDGTTSTAQGPPAHTFAKAGTYAVNLTVTDSLGGSVKSNVTITVKAAPSTGFSLSGSTLTYLILGIVALLVVIVAVVLLTRRRKKPATAQPWQPGAPPPGAGAEVPPGVGGSPPPPPPPS